jgi:uncharacterized protein YndB with AHSA1/START domain
MTTTAMTDSEIDRPVRQSITVRASVERAFRVFTAEFDSWWPRSHHIGTSPMTKSVIEGRVGGRCYSEQENGDDCPWGSVLAWDPPHRFAIAWQINPQWQYEPDLAKSSEVEVTFTSVGEKQTRVDLVHRHFSRHGAGGDTIRDGVGAPGGWGTLLEAFAAKANE